MGIAVTPQILPEVVSFIDKPIKMLIDGKWVDSISGKKFSTYNPATGEVLAQIAEGDREDIDLAVKAARKAFDHGAWRKMTASQRARLIWKLADLLEAHTEEFAYLESLDNGKPLSVARVADVPLAVCSATWQAGRRRLKATRFRFPYRAESILPTRFANLSASSDKSFPGISRCSWPHGNLARRWRPAAPSY